MAFNRCVFAVRIFGVCTALGGLALILNSVHPYIRDLLNITDSKTNGKFPNSLISSSNCICLNELIYKYLFQFL